MQIRAALDLVEKDMEAIAAALADLSRRYRDTPMAGRSNLQQAVPLTFGFKTATLLAAMQRHRERLAQLRPRVLVGEFAGAVGTLASLGADGLKVQAALMDELGLGQPEIAWHTVRDRIGEVGCFLGLVTGTLGKISMDVKLLMQTEVAEVYEPFHEGRGSSSTMPQKRNPISCLYIHSNAALVRQHTAALLEAAVADHERSTGPWEIEWIALPEIFLLSAGALAQTRVMLPGLEVDAKRMRANLDLTLGMVVSEAVMMGLGPHLGRQRAHDLVYDICRKVAATGSRWSISGAGCRHLQASHARGARQDVRPRRLPRARRRDGRQGAGARSRRQAASAPLGLRARAGSVRLRSLGFGSAGRCELAGPWCYPCACRIIAGRKKCCAVFFSLGLLQHSFRARYTRNHGRASRCACWFRRVRGARSISSREP